MLQNEFFTITKTEGAYPSFSVWLSVDARHRIFEGHFPGQPVVPGVCLMQMVREVTETVFSGGHKMRLVKAEQLKFLSALDPNRLGVLEMRLEGDRKDHHSIRITAILMNDKKTCFKFNGLLVNE